MRAGVLRRTSMKWIRRGLLVLLAIPVLAVVLLVAAGQRSEAGRTRAQLVIGRSPEVVFRHIEDPELLQKWTGLHEVELPGEPPLRVGSRARVSVVARGQFEAFASEVLPPAEKRCWTCQPHYLAPGSSASLCGRPRPACD
jgi:hypothetical protein